MAYNKAKEEYKWKVWKEQEEKKLRELGVSEEVIAELRDYDWNCFKQERNYKNHQMPDTDFIERTEDASGKWEIQQPVNVQDFIKSLDDNKLRKELQKLDQVTLYIILLKTFGCNGVQREHNKKLNNGLPILHKVPPKRDYGRYFCIMAEKGGTSHGGLTEKLSPFFHAKKQEVNAYGR